MKSKVSLTMLTPKGHKKSLEFNVSTRSEGRHFENQRKYYLRLGWEILSEEINHDCQHLLKKHYPGHRAWGLYS